MQRLMQLDSEDQAWELGGKDKGWTKKEKEIFI
jgi:hypothetical protein